MVTTLGWNCSVGAFRCLFGRFRGVAPRKDSAPLDHLASTEGSAWPRVVRPEESGMAAVNVSASSAAGFYFNEANELVVLVRDSADFALAESRVSALVANGTIRTPERRRPLIRVQKAQFSFGQLANARDLLGQRLHEVDGVTSLDLDERANRVLVGVSFARQEAATQEVMNLARAQRIDTAANCLPYSPVS
jgi:hypothetical protein